MKNLLLFLLLSGIFAIPSHGQNWFQNNPHWDNYFSFGLQGPGYEHITMQGDTVLQGQSAVLLKRSHDMVYANDFVDVRQMRQQGDTVWTWNPGDHEFYVHYNFSLAVGDSVAAPWYWGGGEFKYYLDSVGTLSLDGQILRFQRVHFYSDFDYYQSYGLIIETIGFVEGEWVNSNTNYHSQYDVHLFPDEPSGGVLDGPVWWFCHYENDQLQYNNGNSCPELTSQQEPTSTSSTFRIQPNPFHDAFSLTSKENQGAAYLRIFDAAGRLVMQTSPPFTSVSTTALQPGLYFLEITLRNGSKQFCKAVKE